MQKRLKLQVGKLYKRVNRSEFPDNAYICRVIKMENNYGCCTLYVKVLYKGRGSTEDLNKVIDVPPFIYSENKIPRFKPYDGPIPPVDFSNETWDAPA